MADIFSIFGNIAVDNNQANASLKETEGLAMRTTRSMGTSFKQIGQDARSAGFALSFITAPLAILGGMALKTSAQFEEAMNRVEAITEATGEEMQVLTDLAREMGATTRYSASDAADALGYLAQAGFSTEEMMSALPGVLNMAAAEGMGLARAADVAAGVLRGFSLDASEMGMVADVLAKTSASTNTTITDLGTAFSYAGPLAKMAGYSFEETAAALGLLSNQGIQAERAGTALRGGIQRLLRMPKPAQKALDNLGVAVKNSSQELLSMSEIMRRLEEAGADTTDMINIFGIEAGTGMTALLAEGGDKLDELTLKLNSAEGSAARMAATMEKGFMGAFREFQSMVEELMISIGDSGLLELGTQFFAGATEMVRGLTKLSPATLKWATIIGGAALAAGPLLIVIGQISIMLSAVATPIGLAITGFTALAATFAVLVAKYGTVENVFRNLPAILGGVVANIRNFAGDVAQGFAEGLAALVPAVVQRFGEMVASVRAFLGIRSPSTVFMSIGSFVAAGFASGLFDNLPGFEGWVTAARATLGDLLPVAQQIGSSFSLLLNRDTINSFTETFASVSAGYTELGTDIQNANALVVASVTALGAAFAGVATQFGNLRKAGFDVAGFLGLDRNNINKIAFEAVSEVFYALQNTGNTLRSKVSAAGFLIGGRLGMGIRDGLERLEPVTSAIGSFLDNVGRVMEPFTQQLRDMWAALAESSVGQAFQGQIRSIQASIQDLFASIAGSRTGGAIREALRPFFEEVATAFNEGVLGYLKPSSDSLTSLVSFYVGQLRGVAKDIVNGFKTGFDFAGVSGPMGLVGFLFKSATRIGDQKDVQEFTNILKGVGKNAVDKMAAGIRENIPGVYRPIFDQLVKDAQTIMSAPELLESITEKWVNIAEAVLGVQDGYFDESVSKAQVALDQILGVENASAKARIEAMKTFVNDAKTNGAAFWEALANVDLSAFADIDTSSLKDVAAALADVFKQLDLTDVGDFTAQGFVDSLSSSGPRFVTAAQEMVNRFIAAVKGALGIASPSRVMFDIGTETGEGFIGGLSNTFELTIGAAIRFVKDFTTAFAPLYTFGKVVFFLFLTQAATFYTGLRVILIGMGVDVQAFERVVVTSFNIAREVIGTTADFLKGAYKVFVVAFQEITAAAEKMVYQFSSKLFGEGFTQRMAEWIESVDLARVGVIAGLSAILLFIGGPFISRLHGFTNPISGIIFGFFSGFGTILKTFVVAMDNVLRLTGINTGLAATRFNNSVNAMQDVVGQFAKSPSILSFLGIFAAMQRTANRAFYEVGRIAQQNGKIFRTEASGISKSLMSIPLVRVTANFANLFRTITVSYLAMAVSIGAATAILRSGAIQSLYEGFLEARNGAVAYQSRTSEAVNKISDLFYDRLIPAFQTAVTESEVFKAIGMVVGESVQMLSDIFNQLSASVDNLASSTARATKTSGFVVALTAMANILFNVADGIAILNVQINKGIERFKALEPEARRATLTFAAIAVALQVLMNNFGLFAAAGGSGLFTAISYLGIAVKPTIVGLGLVGAAIALVVVAIRDFNSVATAATSIFNGFKQGLDAIEASFGPVARAAAVAAATVLAMTTVSRVIFSMASALGALGKIAGTTFTMLKWSATIVGSLTAPMWAVGAATVALAAAMYLLFDAMTGGNTWQILYQRVNEFITNAAVWGPELATTIREAVVVAFDQLKDVVKGLMTGLFDLSGLTVTTDAGAMFEGFGEKIRTSISEVMRMAFSPEGLDLDAKARALIGRMANALIDAAPTVLLSVREYFVGFWDGVFNVRNIDLSTQVGQLSKALGGFIRRAISTGFTGLLDFFGGALLGIFDVQSVDFSSRAGQLGETLGKWLYQGVQAAVRVAVAAAVGIPAAFIVAIFNPDAEGIDQPAFAFGVRAFGAVMRGIRSVMEGAVQLIPNLLVGIFTNGDADTRMGQVGREIGRALRNGIIEVVETIAKVIYGILKDVVDDAVAQMQTLMDALNPAKWIEKMAVPAASVDVTAGFLPGDLDFLAKDLKASMERIGTDAALGLIEGLESEDEAVQRAAINQASRLVHATREELDTRSPSKVYFSIGENIGQGLVQGIHKTQSAVDAVGRALGTGVTKATAEGIASGAPEVTSAWDDLVSGFSTMGKGLWGVLTSGTGNTSSSAMVADIRQTSATINAEAKALQEEMLARESYYTDFYEQEIRGRIALAMEERENKYGTLEQELAMLTELAAEYAGNALAQEIIQKRVDEINQVRNRQLVDLASRTSEDLMAIAYEGYDVELEIGRGHLDLLTDRMNYAILTEELTTKAQIQLINRVLKFATLSEQQRLALMTSRAQLEQERIDQNLQEVRDAETAKQEAYRKTTEEYRKLIDLGNYEIDLFGADPQTAIDSLEPVAAKLREQLELMRAAGQEGSDNYMAMVSDLSMVEGALDSLVNKQRDLRSEAADSWLSKLSIQAEYGLRGLGKINEELAAAEDNLRKEITGIGQVTTPEQLAQLQLLNTLLGNVIATRKTLNEVDEQAMTAEQARMQIRLETGQATSEEERADIVRRLGEERRFSEEWKTIRVELYNFDKQLRDDAAVERKAELDQQLEDIRAQGDQITALLEAGNTMERDNESFRYEQDIAGLERLVTAEQEAGAERRAELEDYTNLSKERWNEIAQEQVKGNEAVISGLLQQDAAAEAFYQAEVARLQDLGSRPGGEQSLVELNNLRNQFAQEELARNEQMSAAVEQARADEYAVALAYELLVRQLGLETMTQEEANNEQRLAQEEATLAYLESKGVDTHARRIAQLEEEQAKVVEQGPAWLALQEQIDTLNMDKWTKETDQAREDFLRFTGPIVTWNKEYLTMLGNQVKQAVKLHGENSDEAIAARERLQEYVDQSIAFEIEKEEELFRVRYEMGQVSEEQWKEYWEARKAAAEEGTQAEVDAEGELKDQRDKQVEEAKQRAADIAQGITDGIKAIGDRVGGETGEVINKLADIGKQAFDSIQKGAMGGLTALLAGIGAAAQAIGTVLGALGNSIFDADAKIGSAEWLRKDYWDRVTSAMTNWGEAVSALASGDIVGTIVNIVEMWLDVIGDFGNGAAEVDKHFQDATASMKIFSAEGVEEVARGMGAIQRISRGGLLGFFGGSKEAIVDPELVDSIVQMFQDIENTIQSGFENAALSMAQGKMSPEGFKDALKKAVYDAITKAITDAVLLSAQVFEKLGPLIEDYVNALLSGNYDEAANILGQINTEVEAIASELGPALYVLGQQAGQALGQGVADGMAATPWLDPNFQSMFPEAQGDWQKQAQGMQAQFADRQRNAATAFQNAQNDRQDAFNRGQQLASRAFSKQQQRESQAFSDRQRAQSEAFQEKQEAAAERFQERQEAAAERFQEKQEREREAFETQQERREEKFQAEQTAQEKAEDLKREARDLDWDRKTEARSRTRQKIERIEERKWQDATNVRQEEFNERQQAAQEEFNEQQRKLDEEQQTRFEAQQKAIDAQLEMEFAADATERETIEMDYAKELVREARRKQLEANLRAEEMAWEDQKRAAEKAFEDQQKAEQAAFDLAERVLEDAHDDARYALEQTRNEQERLIQKAHDDAEKKLDEAFDARQRAAEDLFNRQQEGREKAFSDKQKADAKAFQDGQQRASKAFQKAQEDQSKAFQRGQESASRAFQEKQQNEADRFADGQQAAAKRFADKQKADADRFAQKQQREEIIFRKKLQEAEAEFWRRLWMEQWAAMHGITISPDPGDGFGTPTVTPWQPSQPGDGVMYPNPPSAPAAPPSDVVAPPSDSYTSAGGMNVSPMGLPTGGNMSNMNSTTNNRSNTFNINAAVRSDADIDALSTAIANKVSKANRGI